MAFRRLTTFFQGGGYSWSESFYSMQAPSIAQALADGQALAVLRNQLLGSGIKIPQLRASDDDVFRDSVVVKGPDPLSDATISTNIGRTFVDADMPFLSVLIRYECDAAGVYYATKYFSGAPDTVLEFKNQPSFTAKYDQLYKQWKTELTSGRWGLKFLQKDGAGARRKGISATAAAAGDPLTVTLAGHGLAIGDSVRLSLWKGVGVSINKVHTVLQVPDANTFTLQWNNSWGTTTPGYVQKRLYTVQPILQMQVLREASRKRGNSFLRPHGRR